MTDRRAASPLRLLRTVATPAISCGIALTIAAGSWVPAASAAGSTGTGSGSSSVSALQTQAQELAGEIAADGRTLDELAASYQAAQLNLSRLTGRQAAIRAQMAGSARAVAQARAELKQQALLAYLTGGAPVISAMPAHSGVDPGVGLAYAEIVAGGQKRAVDLYRATLNAEAAQQAALDATARQAQASLATIRTTAAQAAVTLTAQRQALAQVQGQLAVAVADVQARQQAAEQAQEKAALTAQGQLPPSSPASAPAGPGKSSPPSTRATTTTRPASPSTTPATTAPPKTAPPTTAPPATTPPSGGSGNPAQAPGANQALAYARAQLGKPYQWGGAGPDSFDCSGLVMMAWEQAGIYFPHLAQSQYDLTARIPLSALIPGDLVFFGTPDNVYHVGIYIGSGDMIDAPETGQNVSIQSIYWDSLLGAGRVTTSS